MSVENIPSDLTSVGITKFCGSVVNYADNFDQSMSLWEMQQYCNNKALELRDSFGGKYIPGFHIHPDFVRESCDEIERMHGLGVKLIGELVPYFFRWKDYSGKGLDEILDCARQYDMVVSFHATENNDQMDEMVKRHPDVVFVAAHPGEYWDFCRHLERMEMSENYHVDLSGYGLFRHGMLRAGINRFGADRFLFGSDYPTCNPYMYVGGVLLDPLLTDAEKEAVFSGNAKRLLGL